ncbi:BOP1-like WD40 protein [Plasmodium knowlesi strain H]|uniref:Ribosome biogenesis protein BOP1 homolog n=3 Tax=Plasmodium knowlesi TaxID=5850 RepID=A0A5K1TUN4_PLAKH|nr:ribosome biogenesis protein BOP1, putative [Plasmodium knowlesi strain H]OTN67653.1 Ribosome biogenesis protein BOP1-like protein [Plasmodium knowlesi]CAA9990549.1 ribosome biogenesis protein BOP1, putative [Plasmodium knowlesi strain H]SBO19803.1 BOP1-like WD40 protein [Plasmodium knowlesi strain H]SBO22380.1 BOP1-like WD40 protein [Plasmodium knowlesi strain H]VVS80023.1 ribosome biogenesis protein BOP1, putative [Plasmodium knowlesi strain H]|eukprot:XP_002260934.1 BOP1-like WD40 protein [Plasmodium knowlesi strain H]
MSEEKDYLTGSTSAESYLGGGKDQQGEMAKTPKDGSDSKTETEQGEILDAEREGKSDKEGKAEETAAKMKKKKKKKKNSQTEELVEAGIKAGMKQKKKRENKSERKSKNGTDEKITSQKGSEKSNCQTGKKKSPKEGKGKLPKGRKQHGGKYIKKETDYEDTTGSDLCSSSVRSENTKRGKNIFANEEIEESDDEYNLSRLGNFDMKHYEDLDILGYDIWGNKIQKTDENAIDDFIESKTDKNAWRKIKDKKNNRIVELTNQDLEIIRSIRQNKVAKYLNEENYVYENEKEEYKLGVKEPSNRKYKQSAEEKRKIEQIIMHLMDKEKNPEKYKKEDDEYKLLYDLWRNKIYDDFNNFNEMNLPNILPGHKYSYNPPPELMYNSAERRKILKQNNDAFIPQNFEKIRNIEFYKKTYFELYQRCLDLYLCSRSLKNVLHIKKEDLLPKLPSTQSLKPYPQYPFVKYNMDEAINGDKNKYLNQIDVMEDHHIVYVVQCGKLYIFDILTSYNIAVIDLAYYYGATLPRAKGGEKKGGISFDNIRIKANKAYDIVAVSFGNTIFLFHYENFIPPAKSSADNIEEVYRTDSKRRKNSAEDDEEYSRCDDTLSEERDSEGEAAHLSGDDDDGHFEGSLDDDEDDEDNDDEDDENHGDDELDKNEEDAEEKHSGKKCEQLSKTMAYCKTKGLLSVFHKNFKTSEEYVYSPDVDVKWKYIKPNDRKIKYCVAIQHEGKIRNFSWNKNGNYLSVTCLRKVGQYHYCYLHHLKSMKSIKLIKKYNQKRGDLVQSMFFPSSPYFLAAFENGITIYNLKAKSKNERIVKKLRGIQNITCVDVHINESYILSSDENGNVFIFDLDLSCNPYKKFHLQECSLKKVEFHKKYNLFYSLSSNGVVNLFYAKFFQDYVTNPVLLPITQLSSESKICDVTWSGRSPWLFAHTEGNFSVLYT